jgi:hypothetical protein
MPVILILIGAVILVAALRNTQGDLATALETDLPGFFKWFLAVAVVGGLGFVPGMKVPSRWLLALVLVVIFLVNYVNVYKGFTSLVTSPPQPSTATQTPAQAYVASPTNPQISQAEITGTSANAGNINAAGQVTTVTSPLGAFDPAAYLTAFEAGVGGFGGIV